VAPSTRPRLPPAPRDAGRQSTRDQPRPAHDPADAWHDAVLIIDADVLLTGDALWHMAGHFADAEIGA